MSRKLMTMVIIGILMLGILGGCKTETSEVKTMGDISYQEVNIEELNEEMKSWYQENYKSKGVYDNVSDDGQRYILLSAGEKETGGYSVDILSIIGEEDEIKISGKVNVPDDDQMVTQARTYPYSMVKIEDDGTRDVVLDVFEEEKIEVTEDIEVEGSYVGQIDNNFVEIKVEGEPRAFMLTDTSRDKILELETGDEVNIVYYENQNGQLILKKIEKRQ